MILPVRNTLKETFHPISCYHVSMWLMLLLQSPVFSHFQGITLIIITSLFSANPHLYLLLLISNNDSWCWLVNYTANYRKRGKFAGLHFCVFMVFRSTAKIFHEYKPLSVRIINNEQLWPRQHENISVKTLMALKPWIFSPANLSRLQYDNKWYIITFKFSFLGKMRIKTHGSESHNQVK